MNIPLCSSCHQRAPSFRDLCGICLDSRLAISSSTSSSVESGSPTINDFNQTNLHPSGSHPQSSNYPNYMSNQPSNQESTVASGFGATAFKHAAAKLAAHNNVVQYPASTQNSFPTNSMTQQHVFDPLAAAKDKRTATPFPVGQGKRARGGAAATISTRPRSTRSITDAPAFDGSTPRITVRCGFEAHKASKWAKEKPIPVTRSLNIFNPQAYEELRLDLWTYFLSVYVPNDLKISLDPSGFAFTTLGSQEVSIGPLDFEWWFSNHNSIMLIYDHSRYEHSCTAPNSPPHQIPKVIESSNATLTGRANQHILPLLYIDEKQATYGIERLGISCEPSLVYSSRGNNWQTSLQWFLQDDGNTIESDFIAYRPTEHNPRSGRTNLVESIEIWHPDGPKELISKTSLKNQFNIRIVSPTTTSRLYTAVDLLLRQFVVEAKNVPGLSSEADFWKILNELRLVDHIIISSEMPNLDSSGEFEPEENLQGPLTAMHAEEVLNLPLESYGSSMFFGFPLVNNPTNMHYIMDAFIHWTYQHSNGQRFVTDLHGSGSVLTNPQIMDTNPAHVWGSRNGRASAVALMVVQHTCKLGCKLLRLPPLKLIPVQHDPNTLVWRHAQKSTSNSPEVLVAGKVDIQTFLAASAPPARPAPPTLPNSFF